MELAPDPFYQSPSSDTEIVLSPEKEGTLPFQYVLTHDKKEAEFVERRKPGFQMAGKEARVRSDEEILTDVRRKKEGQAWYTSEYWRKKSKPVEQIKVGIGDRQVGVYNFDTSHVFDEDRMERLKYALGEMARHFPTLLDKIKYFLVDDIQQKTAWGDEEKYPLNGMALSQYQAFRMVPRGMEIFPHRIAATSNFEGTIVHESTHLLQEQFREEWWEKFKWEFCSGYPDVWERRLSPNGETTVFYHKETGEVSLQQQFPLRPDQCVTEYARINVDEDICESMVAYIYDPGLLRSVSPEKYEILKSHDAELPELPIDIRRVPEEEIGIPQPEPQVVKYYIEEPEEVEDPIDGTVIINV